MIVKLVAPTPTTFDIVITSNSHAILPPGEYGIRRKQAGQPVSPPPYRPPAPLPERTPTRAEYVAWVLGIVAFLTVAGLIGYFA